MKTARRLLATILSISLLLCGCQTGSGEQPQTPETVGQAVQTPPPPQDWVLTGQWQVDGPVLTASGQGATAVNTAWSLDAGWQVSTAVTVGDASCIRLLLCKESGEPVAAASLTLADGRAAPALERRRSDRWETVAEAAPVALDAAAPAELTVYHLEGSPNVGLILTQGGKELTALKTEGFSPRDLSQLRRAGVSAEGNAEFSGFSVTVPQAQPTPIDRLLAQMDPEDPGFYLALAEAAEADMLANFWEGDSKTGGIMPTWGGYRNQQYDDRGKTWETAIMLFGMYDMWRLTGEEHYYDRLAAEARFLRNNYTDQEWENAGGHLNWASDDCAWNAMMLLCMYSVSGDTWFVDRAINLLDNARARWYDEELGGLRYSDGVDHMSLYETGHAWSWLQLWEITGDQRFYDLALQSYEGMHYRLGKDRDDGIYYAEANKFGPRGGKTHIMEAGSASMLSGNLCMAALSAKFYRITGNQEYLDRVYRINEGILLYYDKDGVLINDRDAWTNGTFTAFYASEVLTLPGTEAMQEMVKNTALSIVTNARTEDGYYGGSWSGPADGSGSAWYQKESKPQQIMTSGTSVLMVIGAALLEAGTEHYTR